MSFVPDGNGGFKLLLAAPNLFMKMLKRLSSDGHGDAILFKGKKGMTGNSLQKTVNEILGSETLEEANLEAQSHIDYNRERLIKELHLKEENIIDLPACYYYDSVNSDEKKMSALMPGMVNMAVFGRELLIPKPFGPIVDNVCVMESYANSKLEKLNLNCNYIDDWYAYHIQDGEVHCGTNIHRKVFVANWWEESVD